MKSINVIINPIVNNNDTSSIKSLRIKDDDNNINVNRLSTISTTTNNTIDSSRSISNSVYQFFIDRRSITSIDTNSNKDSIGKSNTNWHTDRALIYTYYSCIYDNKALSPASLVLIILVLPLIISLPNLIIPLGTSYDTSYNSNSYSSSDTNIQQQIDRPPINGNSYIIFQMVYCTFGYYMILYQFFNPFRKFLSRAMVYGIIPLLLLVLVYLIYYALLIEQNERVTERNNQNAAYLAFLPLIGITTVVVILALVYLFLSIYYDCIAYRVRYNDLNSSYLNMFVKVIVFASACYLCYTWCVQYTLWFSDLDVNVNSFFKAASTFIFLWITLIFKVICNFCAQLIDKNIPSNTSTTNNNRNYYCMYMISCIQIDIYIITFHRNLFTFLTRY